MKASSISHDRCPALRQKQARLEFLCFCTLRQNFAVFYLEVWNAFFQSMFTAFYLRDVTHIGHKFKALSCTPTYYTCLSAKITNLSLTTSNFISTYMHKLRDCGGGGRGVQLCGCTRQGLKVVPCTHRMLVPSPYVLW